MPRSTRSGLPVARLASRLATAALLGMTLLSTACISASPAAPSAATAERVEKLPTGAFYLRTIDGSALPVAVPGGQRIESGFVVADSTTVGLVGFGESVSKDRSASVHLASGSALVVGNAGNARVAHVTWQSTASATRADSVLWSADSVVVYRTGTAPSIAGAGHRLVYTRTVPSDTL